MAVADMIGSAVLAVTAAALVYFVRWTLHDIKRENRPEVTNEMLDQAYIDMLESSELYVIDDDDD